VYFNNFHVSSLKRLEFAKDNSTATETTTVKKSGSKSCYFIEDPILSRKSFMHRRKAFKNLSTDPTIEILKSKQISFVKMGFLRSFQVYEYAPKFKQSCYSNGFNQFVTTENIRNLLIGAKDIKFTGRIGVGLKNQSVEEKYDLNSELVSYKGYYIIQNFHTQTPFGIKILLNKNNLSYSLRVEIESYYFYGSPNMNMSSLGIVVTPSHNSQEITDINTRFIKGSKYNILPKKTLASLNGSNNLLLFNEWNYNQIWYKTIGLPPEIKLLKGQFYLDLVWEMFLMSGNFTSEFSSNIERNLLTLKTPTNNRG